MRCVSAVFLFATGAMSKGPHHSEAQQKAQQQAPQKPQQEAPQKPQQQAPQKPQQEAPKEAPKPFDWHQYVPTPPPNTGAGGPSPASGANNGAGGGFDWHQYIPTPMPKPSPAQKPSTNAAPNKYSNPYWGGLAPSTPSPYAPGGAMAHGPPVVSGGSAMVVDATAPQLKLANSAMTTIEAAEAGAQCAKQAGSQVPLSTLLNDAKKIDAQNDPRAALPEGERTVCGVIVRTHACVSKTSFAGNAIFAPLNTAVQRCSTLTVKVAGIKAELQPETQVLFTSSGTAAQTGATTVFGLFAAFVALMGAVFVLRRRNAEVPLAPAESATISDKTPCAEKGKAYETL